MVTLNKHLLNPRTAPAVTNPNPSLGPVGVRLNAAKLKPNQAEEPEDTGDDCDEDGDCELE